MSKVAKAAAIGYYVTRRRPRSSVRLNKRQTRQQFVSPITVDTYK